jgi:hypothetical protein
VYEFNSIQARYRTVWPALVTILFWRWTVGMFRSLSSAMPGRTRRRRALAGVAGLVPALLLVTGYLSVIVFVIYWPIAFLQMLPLRITIHRNGDQFTPSQALSFSTWSWLQNLATRMRRHRAGLTEQESPSARARQ